jgi:hypothetical protein
MAAAVMFPPNPPPIVGPTTKRATRPTNALPKSLIDNARTVEREPFDVGKHLDISPPQRLYTMAEIGLEGQGISPTAASEPFPLFTPEAVQQMRAEIFSEPVLASCQYASSFAKNMIRGFGPRCVSLYTEHDAKFDHRLTNMIGLLHSYSTRGTVRKSLRPSQRWPALT